MSARAYLSIGDVLTLLREEFPDVTISKIRFLESQGLVNPERSPSGYRKFYDHDVERLRWVLRQQRENFLPLRVIRDRLARAGNGAPLDEPVTDDAPDPADGGEGGRPARRARSEAVGSSGASEPQRPEAIRAPVAARVVTAVAATRMAPEGVGNGSSLPTERQRSTAGGAPDGWPGDAGSDPGTRAATETEGAEGSGGEHRAPPFDGRDMAVPSPAPNAGRPAPDDRQPDQRAVEATPAHAASGPAAQPAEHPPAHVADKSAAAPTEPSGAGGGVTSSASAEVSSGPGTSLTLEELCETAGLPSAVVAALESFGLVEPVNVGGATYYEEEAVTVAKLTAELGRYGIEPRHLRVYRNAVDREVGLIEQVVMPLLRQRNPAARQRAVEAATELTQLGEQLRASLLRRGLRRQLGS